MAHHRGPKTTTQDLIFYYDTGNEKSFAGEPTTNIFTSYGSSGYGDISNNGVSFDVNGTGTFIRMGYGQTFGGYTIKSSDVVYKYDLGVNGCHYHGNDVSIPAGSYATFSFDYYISPDATNLGGVNSMLAVFEQTLGGSVTLPNTNKGVWQSVSFTSGPTSGGNLRSLLYPGHCGLRLADSGYILYKNPQVELKNHKTPFINGTRSVTQGLLDLTRNETINLSSVSFDSNAQMSFDGTDDFIDTNFSPTSINNSTIEAVVYRNTATGRYEAIIQNNVDSDDALYVYPSGILGFWPCAPSSLTVPIGQWSYVAVSYNGSTLTYCVNGVIQVITTTCEHIMDWDFLRIGAHGSGDGERWIGKIAIAKLYNRSLTSSELYQNYNAIKTRFGI
jgi:hypothetical protein